MKRKQSEDYQIDIIVLMTALREIVVFIRSREGYNWAIAFGTPRAIAQF